MDHLLSIFPPNVDFQLKEVVLQNAINLNVGFSFGLHARIAVNQQR